jgi:ADP-ribose pyrophosphatase
MSKYYSKLIERKINSKTIYKGTLSFNVDSVRLINGKEATREYLVHPGACAILPVIGNKIVLVEQYRYPVKSVMLEVPAGKMKKGQSALSCAKAELSEETGYKAKKFTRILSFNPTCAFSDEILHIYVAEGLTPGKTHMDDDEFVNTKVMPLSKAYDLIKKGKIRDSKTIIALLYYKAFVGK